MGGRYYYHKKATVEESCDLSIFWLNKSGMLTGRRSMPITWTSSRSGKETSIFLTADVTDDPHVQLAYTVSDSTGNTTGTRAVTPVMPLAAQYFKQLAETVG